MEDDTDSATLEKRQVKPTAKAMEDTLQRKIGSRKASLAQLTAKKNEMLHLMDDDGNLEVVKTKLAVEFNKLFGEFCELNISVKGLFQKVTSEEEMNSDQQYWFKPKADSFKDFSDQVDAWIEAVHRRMEEAREVNESVNPSDSISEAASRKSKKSKASSGRSSASSASSARLKAELERAALMARAAALKRKEALANQEAKLKAEQEELEIQTALAATDAKLKVLQKFEGADAPQKDDEQSKLQERQPVAVKTSHGEPVTSHNVAAEYHGSTRNKHNPTPLSNIAAQSYQSARSDVSDVDSSSSSSSAEGSAGSEALPTVMQRQNDITDLLIKQQKLSTLPPQNIPIFKGDPLEYKLFIRAFECMVSRVKQRAARIVCTSWNSTPADSPES